MQKQFHPLCVLFLLLALPATAPGWTRFLIEDTTLVKHAELIVIGRLKTGSIVHVAEAAGGRSGSEHRAVLIVTEVMKGRCDGREIPIIIHYGLKPVVGGRAKQEGRQQIIEIHDTGNSGWSPEPIVSDASKDNLWF